MNRRHADFQSSGLPFEIKGKIGREYHDKPGTARKHDTRLNSSQSLLSQNMKPVHKRMSRMLGYCLMADAPSTWAAFSVVAAARLSASERAILAFSALRSLQPAHAETAAAAALRAGGAPLPAFLGGLSDARFWASYATPQELRAYALAAYEAMGAKDQAAFFKHISTIEVAA